jgi:hypothetical protein
MKTSRPVQIVLMIRAIPYLPITRQLTAWFIGMNTPRAGSRHGMTCPRCRNVRTIHARTKYDDLTRHIPASRVIIRPVAA